MKVLVACEYSGTVRDAFIKAGHAAISCDFLPSDSDLGPHHQGDVLGIINNGFDLMIAHPPCTYLSASGMHWTARGLRDPKLTEDALNFVHRLMIADIEKICIENPVSIISSAIRRPDQIVQPWAFGDDASKKTCLWLKGLQPLRPTKIVEPRLVCCGEAIVNGDRFGCAYCHGENKPKERWSNQTNSGQNALPPTADRWKIRSKTYQGIADAMAAQWGGE